jgi:hypothetical protein
MSARLVRLTAALPGLKAAFLRAPIRSTDVYSGAVNRDATIHQAIATKVVTGLEPTISRAVLQGEHRLSTGH